MDNLWSKDGKLIADFDTIYKENVNPWGQAGDVERVEGYNFASRAKLAYVVSLFCGSVTEVGCGLGYALDTLERYVPSSRRFRGVDISYVAIKRARKLFPRLKFDVADITKDVVKDDIIILNECLWYIMHKLDVAISNCKCKRLIVNHAFLDCQRYGRDVIDGWNGLLKYFLSKGMTILHAQYDLKAVELKHGLLVVKRGRV